MADAMATLFDGDHGCLCIHDLDVALTSSQSRGTNVGLVDFHFDTFPFARVTLTRATGLWKMRRLYGGAESPTFPLPQSRWHVLGLTFLRPDSRCVA